jgi:hypothetical protein
MEVSRLRAQQIILSKVLSLCSLQNMEVVAKIHLPPPTLFHIAPFYPTEKKNRRKKTFQQTVHSNTTYFLTN